MCVCVCVCVCVSVCVYNDDKYNKNYSNLTSQKLFIRPEWY